jgi:hypothetical protein
VSNRVAIRILAQAKKGRLGNEMQQTAIQSRKKTKMAKYYVQSGTVRAIIDSEDVERAALWVMHQAMDAVLPLDDDLAESMDGETRNGPHALADVIRVSEIGFDREDAAIVETLEAFQHWFQLYQAVTILAKRL